jgi:hypothetical protein
MAEPLVPVFNRERRGRWLSPVGLDATTFVLADDTGKVRRLALKQEPVPRLAVEVERLLDKSIIADPAAVSEAVILVTADQRVRSLAARDLSPVGSWPLGAPLVGHPVTAGDLAFVFEGAGGVVALGRDGHRLWTIKLDAVVSGVPVVREDSVWFLDRTGRLHCRRVSDGAPKEQLALGVLPSGGLLQAGKEMIVPCGRGTVRPVALPTIEARKP